MQILSARQSYYDKAVAQILIMSDIFQMFHRSGLTMAGMLGTHHINVNLILSQHDGHLKHKGII